MGYYQATQTDQGQLLRRLRGHRYLLALHRWLRRARVRMRGVGGGNDYGHLRLDKIRDRRSFHRTQESPFSFQTGVNATLFPAPPRARFLMTPG